MTIRMNGTMWRVKDPDNLEDWVAAVELAANEFKRKTGQQATHINVLEADVAEQLAEIYDEQGYKFVLGARLPNEVLVGVPQKDDEKSIDQLQRHRDSQAKESAFLTDKEEAELEEKIVHHLNGVKPESEAADKPVYDKTSNTVTYAGVRFLDVHPEDVMRLTKEPERLDWMKEMYDWVEADDKSA